MDKWVVDPETGEGELVPMTPEEEAQAQADQAAAEAAHVAAVTTYAGTAPLEHILTTTDGAFHEIWRFASSPNHVYEAQLKMAAVDSVSSDTKTAEALLVHKRTTGSLVQVGSTVILWACADAATAGWAIQAQVQGTELVIGVRGAAGRTINWVLLGSLGAFAPDGLQP